MGCEVRAVSHDADPAHSAVGHRELDRTVRWWRRRGDGSIVAQCFAGPTGAAAAVTTRGAGARGATLSYPALTAFCRRHGIGHDPPEPAGRYDFAPGQEMQHDTSPH